MNDSERIAEEIEKLRLQLDDIKDKQAREAELIADDSQGEDGDTAMVEEDHRKDDPKGDLAATSAAILKELAGMRSELALAAETQAKHSACLKKQGYKV